jgi:DNA-binding phage protein
MTLHVFDFDPAEYLNDAAAIDAYLKNALETGSPEEIEDAQAVAARARARLAQIGAKAS